MKRVYLDTNIVLDLLEKRREKHLFAIKLIQKLIDEEYEIFISEDMLSTIYYIAKDKKKTLNFYNEILSDEYWFIVPFSEDVIKDAIKFSLNNSVDFEDTLQCLTAKKYNSILITEDKKFINCNIEIVNYQKFLSYN